MIKFSEIEVGDYFLFMGVVFIKKNDASAYNMHTESTQGFKPSTIVELM